MSRVALFLALASATPVFAQNWPQWAASAQHESSTAVVARRIDRIEQQVVIDPNADAMEQFVGGVLLAHYPVPLIDGKDVVVIRKGGQFTTPLTRETQTWNVVDMRRVNGLLAQHWLYESDWKPAPAGSPSWEPVYHPAIFGSYVYAPAAGGAIDRINRETGVLVQRFNPFGTTIDPNTFVTGPLAIDSSGNVFYNAIKLSSPNPWSADPIDSWLVRVGSDGTMKTTSFATLTPTAPAAGDPCAGNFDVGLLPWPPSRDAVVPTVRCGTQRPGMNVAPAIAADGTIYTISRAHTNSKYGYLIAVKPDMTLKWSASLRNRFHDGCDVLLPPSGTPGGCREGSIAGVDPTDNQPGSGAVNDNSTASPVVAPDGNIVYGSYTRYNWQQGHLMMFDPTGRFLYSYPFGWDLTPAVYRHDGTYSVVLKENHYPGGSYCSNRDICPPNRTATTPWDPESFFITQLGTTLQPEWKFQSTNTQSCERQGDGSVLCFDDHPAGFEWCVNAVAIDARGTVYADSEDGNLYAISQGGVLEQRLFLRVALGAAYTPTSIGPDGRVYTQNDGVMFVLNQNSKRRAVKPR